jgi:glycosyltransferase involved in cell wall biosynthesis
MECLEALEKQEGAVNAEIIVVNRCGEETREAIIKRFPWVRLQQSQDNASIPAMRTQGVLAARGKMIAVIEDHCIVCCGWLKSVQRAYQAGHMVVGGPVNNGCVDRVVDWAAFFCEYARFMEPVTEGVVGETPGNNSAYDRRALNLLGEGAGDEVWESFLHERLKQKGVLFYSDPKMAVYHKKTFNFFYFISQRYHYSRSFASIRLGAAPWWKRVAYAGGAAVLPALLLSRIVLVVARKKRKMSLLAQTLPFICVFVLVWAAGEGAGALFGPGNSLEKVE